MRGHSAKPFVIFHLAVGTRLALRKLAPILATAFAAYYLLRPELFNAVFAGLLQRGFLLMGLISSILSLSVAVMASPRVCLGLNGWIRHLPARGLIHRRLAAVAIALSQVPILLVVAALALIAFKLYNVSPFLYLIGLPILGLAAGLCVLHVQNNSLSKPLTFAACVLSTSGHWLFLVSAIVLLIIADLTAGTLSPSRKSRVSQKSFSSSWINVLIVLRALRLRIFLPYLPALFVLGLTSLFLANNILTPHQIFRGVTFGGALSVAVLCSFVANLIAVRRPPWPWSRSLPWSAHQRVLTDSLSIGILALPLFVLITIINSSALWPVAIFLPPFALFSALMIRTAFLYPMGALGRTLLVGTVASVLVCLLPAMSFIFLVSSPILLRLAAAEEKNQKVSVWLEMHHLAAGDSLSWSRQ